MTKQTFKKAVKDEKTEMLVQLITENEVLNEYFNIDTLNKVKKKTVSEELEQLFADFVMSFVLNEKKVDVADLGTFEPRVRGERPAINQFKRKELIEQGLSDEEAKKQATMTIPEQKALGFKPSKKAKEEIKNS